MNSIQTAEQQLGLALQQNDAQQGMIAHISERLAAMEEAGKIGDEKVQLFTTQLHSAASVLADVTALAETNKAGANFVRYKAANPSPFSGLPDTLLPWMHVDSVGLGDRRGRDEGKELLESKQWLAL
jgi:hypothetical protein